MAGMELPASAWYADGLRFGCTQCGDCCGGAPGYVWVSEEEIANIAAFLDIDEKEFRKRYTRREGRRGISLIEKGGHDCIFYENGCQIYPCRPRQCRTWPFWRCNLQSDAAWDMASETCPGMGSGDVYSRAEIEDLAKDDGLP